MNKNIFYCLIVFTGFLLAQTDSVKILIQTNRDSTAFFIDNEFYGVGRNLNLYAEEGIHSLYLVENIKIWDAEIIKDTIIIESSKDLDYEYNFKEKILINTIPQDVYVYEQDSLIGFTPTYAETGFTELKLDKPNYKTINVNVSEVSDFNKPELKYIGEPSKTPFYRSTLFTVLLGTAIALGAATAYYKLEADDLYDEYLKTGDQGLLDNINQYDSQSAGTFIAMELCVGALIYFFLTD